jgi:RNA polymerase sigma-54 factor
MMLRQDMRLSPSVVLAARLLELPGDRLEETVRHELADNPALETAAQNACAPTVYPLAMLRQTSTTVASSLPADIAAPTGIRQRLESDLRLIGRGMELAAAVHLLYSLDERGYLGASLPEIAAECGAPVALLEAGLALLRRLDLPGLGARDLRESLQVQCLQARRDGPDLDLALRLLNEGWDLMRGQRWRSLEKSLQVTAQELQAALGFISAHCRPHPLQSADDEASQAPRSRRPDLVVHRAGGPGAKQFRLEIPAQEEMELRLCDSFTHPPEDGAGGAAARAWARVYAERARQFMAALSQRFETLRRIGEMLLEEQAAFIERGPAGLKALTRREVARRLGLHESTVSRAVSGKTALLPDGRIVALDCFFEAGAPLMDMIERILASTYEPLSDRQLAQRLSADGFVVARRTVTKYRARLAAPAVAARAS